MSDYYKMNHKHSDEAKKFDKYNLHDVEDAVQEIAHDVKDKSHDEIKMLLLDCANIPSFHHDRTMIINAVKVKLKNSLR